MNRQALLLVEDDRQLAGLLTEVLTEAGYAVDIAPDGQRGLHLALTRRYSAMIVDRLLPAIEGADLVSRLRSRGVTAPILMLTALGTVPDRIAGLDAGAEDYLVKPFDINELLARLRAMLRRHPDASNTLSLGKRQLDVTSRQVTGDGAPVELSARECDLLRMLAARPAQVFTRAELLDRVFTEADSPGIVDTYVYYLRRKLGQSVVTTVHGLGYRMGVA